MLRQFTVKVGRFAAGEVFDYPRQTWEQIATSANKPLDKITCDVIPPRKQIRSARKPKTTETATNG